MHFAKADIRCTFGISRIELKAVPSMSVINPVVIKIERKEEENVDLSSDVASNVIITENFVKCEDKNEVEDNSKVTEEICNTFFKGDLSTSDSNDVNNTAPNGNICNTSKKERKFFEPRYISEITDRCCKSKKGS